MTQSASVEILRHEDRTISVQLAGKCPVCDAPGDLIKFRGDWGGNVEPEASCKDCGQTFRLTVEMVDTDE